jgi:NAD(P)-dependent dehydrogenase (short-subunit alcohol dehydrogenase family)
MRQNVTQDMAGKTVVITGASSGIGAVAARKLAQRGATVVPVGRSRQATAALAAELGVQPLTADYARLSEVRALADQLLDRCPTIDVIVHNAGFMAGERCITEDGYELTLQVNYLAPFLLQHLLHERLATAGAHVVVTSSSGHRNGKIRLDDFNYQRHRYSALGAYADSKLADLLFAREIARRTPDTGITAVAFHPGTVATGFSRDFKGLARLAFTTGIGKRLLGVIDNEEGARPLIHLATVSDPRTVNGQYFNTLTADAATSKQARDAELGTALWSRTEDLLGLPVRN